MRLHNFLVDNRNEEKILTSEDYEVFDDDCRRFYAVNPFLDFEGVDGGEDDIHRDANGNISRGGRPSRAETACNDIGRNIRNAHRDEIARQGLIRPARNWYRVNNRVFDST